MQKEEQSSPPSAAAAASAAATNTTTTTRGCSDGGRAFPRKKLRNGKRNPKYVDLCDEDAVVAGQKFVCLSFVSPEKILKNREVFLFEAFVKQWEMAKGMEKFHDFLHFVSFKYKVHVDTLLADFNDFVLEEEAKIKEKTLDDDFKTFLEKNEERLNGEFQKRNGFQTSVRGLKVRGAYGTQEEAEMHCRKIREKDPNHDIFVGPMGIWIPFDPDAYKTGRVEFLEEELNQLHAEKLKNEAHAKQEFDNRIKEAKRKAIEENIKLARKSGNVLTQTLDEEGNLVGVCQNVDFDSREPLSSSSSSSSSSLL